MRTWDGILWTLFVRHVFCRLRSVRVSHHLELLQRYFFNITYHLIQKWLITILVSLGTTCRPIVFNAIPQQPLCYESNFILCIQYEYNVWSYWIIHKIHWVYSLDTWSWLITWLDVDLTDRIEYPMYFFLNVILLITYVWIRDNPY